MKKESLVNNELFTDYKSVAFAADLVERGIVEINNIEIIPIGADKRAFAKDINRASEYFSEQRFHNRLRIEANRESLYDMLPEGLFHRPPKGSSSLDEEGMMIDVRERREEEKQARLFFSPFDLELNHLRLICELYENRLDQKTTYEELNHIFEFGWEEFNLLNKEQTIIWMHLLPEIQQKRNDLNFISKVLTALFNINIHLTDTSSKIQPTLISEHDQVVLGRGALGIDTIIGDQFLPENGQVSVEIGPASSEDIVSFMPGKKNRRIIDMALDYLIPVDTDVSIDFLTEQNRKEIAFEEDGPNVFLGYTVYL